VVRFHLGGGEKQFLNLPCNDFVFLAEELSSRKVSKKRDQLEAVSFGQWQNARFSGQYKKSWKEYQKAFGLGSDETQKVDKSEKEESVKEAVSIIEILNRNNNVKT
jgi:hypothetical protein